MPTRQTTDVARSHRRILWGAAALICFLALARCAAAQAPAAPVVPDTAREVTHTVKTGDTLWDLARTYLKNPFRWPDIFRRNTDIVKNPHWIYPGEVIRIPISEVRPDVVARQGNVAVVARISTVARPPTVFSSIGRSARGLSYTGVTSAKYRAPGVRAGEIEAAPYVDRSGGPQGAGEILAGVDRPAVSTSAAGIRFQLNDLVYFSPPKGSTARLGDRYLAYVLGEEIDDVGQLVIPTAILRVENLTPGQPAVARVIRQFGETRLGQRLVPAEYVTAITRLPRALAGGLTGKVLRVHQDPIVPSLQHYVLLSPAAGNGVSVGDEFTLIDDTMARDDPTPAPPVTAAIAQVVRVTPFASTALILRQLQPDIKKGMPVRLTAKMP